MGNSPMRALVFAYHNVGHACLEVLINEGTEVIAVVTHEDDPREEVWFRSAADLARRNRIPVHTPSDVRTQAFIRWVESLKPDVIFSFYYRNMLPGEILKIPRLGSMNMHGSYLPKYRGRCPVNWALIHGESETGVTLHDMVPKPDAGGIVGQKKIFIGPEDTARDLFDKITKASAELLSELLPLIREGRAPRIQQNEEDATYFGGRRPEDGRIDWSMNAKEIHNLIRAVTHPYPGAFTYLQGKKALIWKASPLNDPAGRPPGEVVSTSPFKVAAGRGALQVQRAQREGDEEMDGEAFAKKYGIAPGAVLKE